MCVSMTTQPAESTLSSSPVKTKWQENDDKDSYFFKICRTPYAVLCVMCVHDNLQREYSVSADASSVVSRSVPVLLSPSRQILMAAAGASEPLND